MATEILGMGVRVRMKLVLKADRLIDGTGADPVPNAAVTIEDGRITQIASGSDASSLGTAKLRPSVRSRDDVGKPSNE